MSRNRTLVLAGLFAILSSSAFGGSLTGTVKDPGGAPFKGAFIQAKNLATKMTHSVLSDRQGRYRIPDLAPGRYDIQVRAVGYVGDPRRAVQVETAAATLDFSLQKGAVSWTDLSNYQAKELLPAGKGKPMLVTRVSRPAWRVAARTLTVGSGTLTTCATPCAIFSTT
jgi:hypothetical protein